MCTWPGFQGPVQSCLKHDVSFASLQKFTGYNPTNEPGGVANGDEMDEAWNPRNKSLADSKLYADILKHGCQLESVKSRYSFCYWQNEWIANYFFGGVGNLADKGWLVTEVDTEHIGGYRATLDADSSEYQYFPCYDLVPATTNAQVTHTHGRGFSVQWNHDVRSCVPGITIKESQTCIRLHFNGRSRTKKCTSVRSGLFTSAFISMGHRANRLHIDYVEVETFLYPDRWEYGSKFYYNNHYVVPKRN